MRIASIITIAMIALSFGIVESGNSQNLVPDYLTENPALKGLDWAQKRALRDAELDALYQEMVRQNEAERNRSAIDEAIRLGLAEMYGETADPVLRRLLRTPGAAAAALEWIKSRRQ